MSALQSTRNSAASIEREKADLIRNERIVSAGLDTFVQVGNALGDIRDRKLYRHSGYKSFEQYLREQWNGLDKSHAYRQITGARIAGQLEGASVPPANESQMRPLKEVAEDDRLKVWEAAGELSGGESPTVATVKEVVKAAAPLAGRLESVSVADLAAKVRQAGLDPAKVEVTVVHPAPAPADEPEPEAPRELTDDEWLATLPARARLASGLIRDRFDAAALCYRRSEPAKEAYRNATRAFRKEAKRDSSGVVPGYIAKVEWFLRLADPAYWLVCEGCGGTSQNAVLKVVCPDCSGEGYHVK